MLIRVSAGDVSGVTALACTAGGAPVLSASGASGAFTLRDGEHQVACVATEGAGNSGAADDSTPMPALFRVDQTAPSLARDLAADACALPGEVGWCRGTQTAGSVAGDATSGLAPGDCPDGAASCAFTRSSAVEGAAVIIPSGAVCDLAGNCAASIYAGPYRIDATAPALNPAVVPDPVPLGGAATAMPNATDGLSGVAAAGCGPLDTGSVGAKTVACAATDVAGNSASGSAAYRVSYAVCVLYDQAKAHRAGSTVPIKLRLCDAAGRNVSAAGIIVTAAGLTKLDGTASVEVEDAGNANPDGDFRYDATLAGYSYNLGTAGLTTGTWRLSFTVAGDPTPHAVQFDVR